MVSVNIDSLTEPHMILSHEELTVTWAKKASPLTTSLTPMLEVELDQALADLDSDEVLSRWKETVPSSPTPEAAHTSAQCEMG